MKVYPVTVFESGDMTTSTWAVFSSKEKAEKYRKDLLNDEELNCEGYYVMADVSEHTLDDDDSL